MSPFVDQTVTEVTQKAVIGASGVAWSFFGMPFDTLAAICTAVYMAFSALLLIPKIIEAIKSFRKKKDVAERKSNEPVD